MKKTVSKKPSLIMITIDGARIDRIRKLRNFQRLIATGTFCTNTITYAPYTIAAMHAIFSGTYGNKTGVDNYYSTYQFKKDSYATLTEYLKWNNYHTIGDVLSELIVPGQGFDDLQIHNKDEDDLIKRHTQFLERANKLKQKEENFFLYLHYSYIQSQIKQNVSKKYNNFSKEYFGKKEENSEAFDTYMEKADGYLGAMLDNIETLGLNDAIIVVQSDHGISIGEKFGEKSYGVFCYDYTAKTFAFFIHPEIFPVTEVTQLTRTIDTTPTILDVLGIEQNKKYNKMDGVSVMPILNNSETDTRYAFIESGNPLDTGEPPKKPNVHAIRTNTWKFIHNDWDNTDELYNITADPEEKHNVLEGNKNKADELRNTMLGEIRGATKAIIIAAGKGTRLKQLTQEVPKCMLPLGDKPLLEYSIDTLKESGIKNVVLIRGYKKDKINYPQFRNYDDPDQHGILSSLMYTKEEMNEPFIALYSDILFDKKIVDQLQKAEGDIVVVADTDWKGYYDGRTDHPIDEAENVIFENNKVKEIGKHIEGEKAHGEFIGMIKCTKKGARILKTVYDQAKETYKKGQFQRASEFNKAYLTDMLQEIVDRGHEVHVAKVKKGWFEFDTVQDYENLQKRFSPKKIGAIA